MKVETKTQTIVSSIVLTVEEMETLKKAQKILDKLGDELTKVDSYGSFCRIYNIVDEVKAELKYITDSVDIENYIYKNN